MTCLLSCFRALAKFDRAWFRLMRVCKFLGKYRLRLLHVDSGLQNGTEPDSASWNPARTLGRVRGPYLTGGEVSNG